MATEQPPNWTEARRMSDGPRRLARDQGHEHALFRMMGLMGGRDGHGSWPSDVGSLGERATKTKTATPGQLNFSAFLLLV